MREERGAVQGLVERAAAAARQAGVRLDTERAAATIHAANADEELGAALDAGRLERWAQDASLGPIPATAAAGTPAGPDAREEAARARRQAARLNQARRAIDAARKKRDRAAARAEKARDELARLEEAKEEEEAALAEAEEELARREREA
jgi:hypothetical protein